MASSKCAMALTISFFSQFLISSVRSSTLIIDDDNIGVRSSVNWGFVAFFVSSYAKFSTCQFARKAEAERMRFVIEDFNRKKSKNTTNSSSNITLPQ